MEKCKECGICAKECPIIKTTELADVSPKEIQAQIKAYLKTGEGNPTVFNRAFSCMQCFRCVDKCCPEGLDLTGARDVLQKLPGINLVEMPRHGKKTVCCGSGAEVFFPNSFETVRDDRLTEASQTGADILVDVCHHCHNAFCDHESKYGFEVQNYASLVADALGIARKDKFKLYKQWGDIDRIKVDAEKNIAVSPFSIEKITSVLNETFSK